MKELTIIPALPSHAPQLTHITRAAKAYWPYSEALLKGWEAELTISEEHIASHIVNVAVTGEAIIAYYSLFPEEGNRIKMENLFVLPRFIGKGIGNELMLHALQICKEIGCHEIWLESDPHAEAFYLKHGFKVIGKKGSSVAGRYLPIMELIL